MRRRSTALVAAAVAVVGLAVGIGIDLVDDGDETSSAPSSDPCLDRPPLVAVAGNVPGAVGQAQVTVLRPDGARAVATGDWVATDPDLAPTGDRLVVTRADGDYESAGPSSETLWTVGLDGADPQPLTEGDVYDTAASWSPDGATVAFVRIEPDTTRVMVVPATGGEPTELVAAAGFRTLDAPAWSPDGSRLAHVRRQLGPNGEIVGAELWTVAADGSGATRLADVDGSATSLDWHPDGSRVLVSAHVGERTGNLAVVDAATGSRTPVARDATFGQWSRRGTHIVHFTRTGVTREADWRLVESPFAGGALGDARDLGITDYLYGYFGLSVGACAP